VRLQITKSPLRIVMSCEAQAPPAIACQVDNVVLDLYHSPNGGWWGDRLRVADSDDEAAEHLRGCLQRLRF
jgi:hypothetical protein